MRCDDADRPPCGCPPGHFCWFCLKDTWGDEIADLLLNHPDLVERLNADRMGVVDGSPALVGQVGEYRVGTRVLTIPALGAGQSFQGGVGSLQLPPGDWMCFSDASWSNYYPGVSFALSPAPAGVSNAMPGGLWGSADPHARLAVGVPAHALIANPIAFHFGVSVSAGPAMGLDTLTMRTQAYRIR